MGRLWWQRNAGWASVRGRCSGIAWAYPSLVFYGNHECQKYLGFDLWDLILWPAVMAVVWLLRTSSLCLQHPEARSDCTMLNAGYWARVPKGPRGLGKPLASPCGNIVFWLSLLSRTLNIYLTHKEEYWLIIYNKHILYSFLGRWFHLGEKWLKYFMRMACRYCGFCM